jgi:hypothetical protein
MTLAAERTAELRRSSRFATAATGAAVFCACLAYAGWSLMAGSADEAGPADEGVALVTTAAQAPDLSPTPEPMPTARLYLDDGTEPSYLPVVNAHHEIPDDAADGVAPAMQQLGFTAESGRAKPTGAVGAWLTGGIETSPGISAGPVRVRR